MLLAHANMMLFNEMYSDKGKRPELSKKKLFWKISENSLELIRRGMQLYGGPSLSIKKIKIKQKNKNKNKNKKIKK